MHNRQVFSKMNPEAEGECIKKNFGGLPVEDSVRFLENSRQRQTPIDKCYNRMAM